MDAPCTYMMSLFPMHKSIEKKFNQLRRTFLWQENKVKQSNNPVKFDLITLSISQGGLGVKSLLQNTSLLQKWLQRFCNEDKTMEKILFTKVWASESLDHQVSCWNFWLCWCGKPSEDCGLFSITT